MSILEKTKTAVAYYEGLRKNHVKSGWEKVICTDGITAVFVNSDYQPQGEEVVFKLDTRNGKTLCQLYKRPDI